MSFLAAEGIVIGMEIRVDNPSKTASSKAIVSFINDDDTVDIIYVGGKGEEESGVKSHRIHFLEPFELNKHDTSVVTGEQWKARGNGLFVMKDFRSALDVYRRGLAALSGGGTTTKLSVGANVLVAVDNSINYRAGMIADWSPTDDGGVEYEVMYDSHPGEEGFEMLESEEVGVRAERLTFVSTDVNDRSVLRAVYLNMAKCYLKLSEPGWAIKCSSIALHIALLTLSGHQYSNKESEAVVRQQAVDTYYFRAKALLMVNRPGFAHKDMLQLKRFDAAKAAQLDGDIKQHRTRMSKINKKLAKDVAKWVDSALSNMSSGGGGSPPPAGGFIGDIDVAEDDEEGANALEEAAAGSEASQPAPSDATATPPARKLDWVEVMIQVGIFLGAFLIFYSLLPHLSHYKFD